MNLTSFLIAILVAPLLGLVLKLMREQGNRKAGREASLSLYQKLSLLKTMAALVLAEPVRAFVLPPLGIETSFFHALFAVGGVFFLVMAALQYHREEVKGQHLDLDEFPWDFCVFAGALFLLQIQGPGLTIQVTTLAFLAVVHAGRKRREHIAGARQRELLLGRLAHELRVPAAAVRSLAESLERGDVDAKDRRRYAGLLVLEAQRLTRGLERSLKVARGAELPSLEKVPLDLSEWAEGLRERWRALLPFFAVESRGATPVSVDPERLDEAFDALLDNAMRYGQEPVTLALRAREDKVELRLTQAGEGVSEALRPVLARRMRGELERDPEARGLGCWAAGAVARAHGGTLRLEDPRTFVMTLPQTEKGAKA